MESPASNPSGEGHKRKIAGDQLFIVEALLPVYLQILSDAEVRSYFVEHREFSVHLVSAVNQWRPKAHEEAKPKAMVAGR